VTFARRAWINQPSASQPLHSMHGVRVIALPAQDGYCTVYPVDGDTVSLRASTLCLSDGWPAPKPDSPTVVAMLEECLKFTEGLFAREIAVLEREKEAQVMSQNFDAAAQIGAEIVELRYRWSNKGIAKRIRAALGRP
jgi:hypothetical protein